MTAAVGIGVLVIALGFASVSIVLIKGFRSISRQGGGE